MGNALQITPLPHLGLIRLRGADGGKFLQGQLSNDLGRLVPERSLLAGYHNPQGRVIALLRLLHWDQDDVLAILPRELATTVSARLAKFILRSRVKLSDESADWQVLGISASAALPGLPAASNSQTRQGGAAFVCVNDTPPRWLAVAPVGTELVLPGEAQAGDPADWVRLEVAAGQPQVVGATSEQFVAQMLNLDRLEAIAFDKGCYTGQEVIARPR